jgi:AraC-like DNA-binding protein
VRSYSVTHPPGRVSLPTQPGWDYILFAHSGLFTATTDTTAWTIPPHRAICIPDGTRVRIRTARRVAIRCLYVDERLGVVDNEIRVVNLTRLSSELLAHAVSTAPMNLDTPANAALITLLAERLSCEPDAPLHLALPSDPAARQVANAIIAEPAVGLEDQLRAASASRRTVERRFKAETQMSLGQWRRRARILAGVGMLGQGTSVTQVAVTLGYGSPSSFVSAFRAELGSPPREFMQSEISRVLNADIRQYDENRHSDRRLTRWCR